MTEISVIVPTYNRKKLLERCISSLLEQTIDKDSCEVIIVDDGGRDGTEDMVKRVFQDSVRYFRQENAGPAKARNLGIKNSVGTIIAFTDDDCVVDKGWLYEIKKTFDTGKDVFWVNGDTKSFNRDPSSLSYKLADSIYLSAKSETNNIAYRREVFDMVGLFDEAIVVPAYEDVDMKRRIGKKGLRRVYEPKAVVWHPYENELGDFNKQSKINGIGLSYYFCRHPFMGFVMFIYEILYVPYILLYRLKKPPKEDYPIKYLLALKSIGAFKGVFFGFLNKPRHLMKDYRTKDT